MILLGDVCLSNEMFYEPLTYIYIVWTILLHSANIHMCNSISIYPELKTYELIRDESVLSNSLPKGILCYQNYLH